MLCELIGPEGPIPVAERSTERRDVGVEHEVQSGRPTDRLRIVTPCLLLDQVRSQAVSP